MLLILLVLAALAVAVTALLAVVPVVRVAMRSLGLGCRLGLLLREHGAGAEHRAHGEDEVAKCFHLDLLGRFDAGKSCSSDVVANDVL